MKIRSVEMVRLDLPVLDHSAKAWRPSYNKSASRAFPINKYDEFPRQLRQIPGEVASPFWVRVEAEDGTWGLGSSTWGNLVEPLITQHFAPLLEGRDCMAIEYLNDLMWRSSMRFGTIGLASVARSAIDLALWDLKGKLLGVPVYTLLGGPARSHIDTYCTSDDLDWSKELGFTAFKISNPIHHKEGNDGLDRLEEKVAWARETVGDKADLMLNPVMSFNVEYALRVFERLKPYRLRWIEEPLMPHDLDGLEQIKAAVPTQPIATGEDHHGRHVFRDMITRRCVDFVQPDIRWCGGLTEALKIYTLAEAAGIATVPHSGASSIFAQHFAFAMPESSIAEFWMASDPGVPLEEAVAVTGMAVPVNGRLVPSPLPGFGIQVAREQILPWR